MDNSMELEAMKASLAQKILTEVDSRELLEKLSKYLQKNLKKKVSVPCQYTAEELQEYAMQGVEDARAGKGMSTDELIKISEAW